ncbi:YdcF family protein [Pelomonas sp. APW6]|uniref:YdcF family protein n=1 Tax=Roseateles subflavus TaxID=3053353 RepID=A0ABT7LPZ7_9BURK|nr:YdcF family protein [Pelomonas sp. APW6]MDL5034494.1 YdcF family protein [Pelomonas sp. APW6]
MDLYNPVKAACLALLAPPGLLLPPLLAGLVLWRRAGRWRLLLPLSLLPMWLSLCEAPALLLQRSLLSPPPPLLPTPAACQAQAHTLVLVLGGGIHQWSSERAGPDLKLETLARLRHGAYLARRCHWPLGFSGGLPSPAKPGDVPEADVAAQVAREELGLSLDLVEPAARDTRENARLSLPLLRARGVRQVVIVTHAEHMPRALRAFQAAALAENASLRLVPAPVGGRGLDQLTPYDWLPSEAGYRRMRYVFYEGLGLLAGH